MGSFWPKTTPGMRPLARLICMFCCCVKSSPEITSVETFQLLFQRAASASLEMDGRPGPVRDAVAAVMKEWLSLLERNVHDAIIAGDVAKDCLPAQLAFELNAIGMSVLFFGITHKLSGNPR